MKKPIPFSRTSLVSFSFVVLLAFSCNSKKMELSVASPDQKIKVNMSVAKNGVPLYSVVYGEDTVILPSALGIKMEHEDFTSGLSLKTVSDVNVIHDEYQLHYGKRLNNSYTAHEKIYHFENAAGKAVDIIFRVSNDGIGFRYYFPGQTEEMKKIVEEKTSFHFTSNTKAWLQPMSKAKTGWRETNPSYEENYVQHVSAGTKSPIGEGWVYPALFNKGETWMLITETGLGRNYCGTKLISKSENAMKVGFPQEKEVFPGGPLNATSTLPWYSPWRVIAIGSLGTIIESTLGTDLADPAIEMDESFIKPGYASWSWAILKDNSVNYAVQKNFIDYAAKMNWAYCLVDVNWDTTIGYDSIAALSKYAQSKDVGLILWYNSSGDWNSTDYHPKSKLLTHEDRVAEFGRLKEMGIKGIKVDFFGGDGQSMIAYYHDIFQDAAKYGLLINCHGATLPRGWHRTYPNLMTIEAVKGFEFITFEQGNADRAPSHCAILPFTRNAFDPMDFTPMCLYKIPGVDRKTTSAFELALPVLFLSGIQHLAETPEGMSHVPGFVKTYLQNLPAQWDETKFIDGYPGKLVVLARRAGDVWHVVGINGEEKEKSLTLDLSFLGDGKKGILITDGEEDLSFIREEVAISDAFKINLKSAGGFVLKIKG